jgi:hypothetical protein
VPVFTQAIPPTFCFDPSEPRLPCRPLCAAQNNQLSDLQITNLLGEGGFAKVFRGLWQGLVVGIKTVVDDGKNEKMVMKNAHEIAILGTLSHPHVTQVCAHVWVCVRACASVWRRRCLRCVTACYSQLLCMACLWDSKALPQQNSTKRRHPGVCMRVTLLGPRSPPGVGDPFPAPQALLFTLGPAPLTPSCRLTSAQQTC